MLDGIQKRSSGRCRSLRVSDYHLEYSFSFITLFVSKAPKCSSPCLTLREIKAVFLGLTTSAVSIIPSARAFIDILVDSTDKSCLHKTSGNHTITTVHDTDLSTCQALNVNVNGGKDPYTLTVVPSNGFIENIDLGSVDDGYTFVNTLPPNQSIICEWCPAINSEYS